MLEESNVSVHIHTLEVLVLTSHLTQEKELWVWSAKYIFPLIFFIGLSKTSSRNYIINDQIRQNCRKSSTYWWSTRYRKNRHCYGYGKKSRLRCSIYYASRLLNILIINEQNIGSYTGI